MRTSDPKFETAGSGDRVNPVDTKLTEVKNEPYDAFTSHAIHLDELKAVAAYQNVEFQVGDILLVRSGYTATYYEYEKSAPERLVEAGTHKPHLTGLAQTGEMKTWLHDTYFTAVAGDAPSFECWPTTQKWHLHEYLLACWGVPIGEMFDLEESSSVCPMFTEETVVLLLCKHAAE
ncbi:cyclase [Fusarium acutatum]|uniref:Cyclase n=1 Tax=Fusarium acutatum TaxID=78861 RepID=A0A8H4J834_9HYPO|nr:cyclase [Fusarium acutatum]